jgi:UDP-N-acetylglucosamine 2-epimerase (non-hydrolysing)
MVVGGARPNFMKVAPLLRELRSRDSLETFLVHTGQHYDRSMSESFFSELGIREPDVNLAVGSGTHAEQTAQVLSRIEPHLLEWRADAVAVVGDVNSTLAATLAAVKLGIPVAHVEAGLRSFDRTMPEEINRLLTDAVAEWLFTTDRAGDENLRAEGVPERRIHFVGNIMIDTLRTNLARARETDARGRLGIGKGDYALLTLHRPSNVDDPARLGSLLEVLEEIHRELPIVFPVHPRTAAAIRKRLGGAEPALPLREPLGYLDMLGLMSEAKLVLTDSGGIQEETTVLGVPCLTLRDTTERPVTVSEGTNTIVGSDPTTIRAEVRKVLDGNGKRGRIPEGWDGFAARRIADVLERDLLGDPG